MRTRNRGLPYGWYPGSQREVESLIAEWLSPGAGTRPPRRGAISAVAPHAGWAFSGRLAALAMSALAEAETVVVVGGHLPGSYPVLVAREEEIGTPCGPLAQDLELASALGRLMGLSEDRAEDNTVEVQLPLVKAMWPAAKVLWLRAPAGSAAMELGSCLDQAARSIGRKTVCLGSTDLTHYGPDYGFEPAGRGNAAEEWVRNVSDKGFIEALLAMDAEAVLARGGEGAACSSGAAAAALSFALAAGAKEADLLGYATSLEVRRASSFVGYCSVGFF